MNKNKNKYVKREPYFNQVYTKYKALSEDTLCHVAKNIKMTPNMHVWYCLHCADCE